jgi:hypothetical protein
MVDRRSFLKSLANGEQNANRQNGEQNANRQIDPEEKVSWGDQWLVFLWQASWSLKVVVKLLQPTNNLLKQHVLDQTMTTAEDGCMQTLRFDNRSLLLEVRYIFHSVSRFFCLTYRNNMWG